jgi:imidazoleglycerol-phosphate dehydratase/histidinol-phosphatase
MKKILFIDRDGTIIKEPEDFQIDSLEKLDLVEGVIPALLELKTMGFKFVMISNQDGLGTDSFPTQDFEVPHNKLLEILSSQGIKFEEILICPHFSEDDCECRKPRVGLVLDYLRDPSIDFDNSYVIGDRESDMKLAANMKVEPIQILENRTSGEGMSWVEAVAKIKGKDRKATVTRKTKETDITVSLNLDNNQRVEIETGIPFFDHMLEQIGKHSNISLSVLTNGDIEIDDHHTVEDTALALGAALSKALSDKCGIGRYGFSLPMDETSASVLLDLGGRPYFKFDGKFSREKVGDLSTEMVKHFFMSLAESLKANIHISVDGENCHHEVEGVFKAFARSLGQAIKLDYSTGLPSTKGTL